MLTRYVTALLLLLVGAQLSAAQSPLSKKCGCAQDLEYVITYVERNLPAYSHDVTPRTRPTYERLKHRLRHAAGQAQREADCLFVLGAYVEFFRDQHTDINGASQPGVNEQDATALQRFQTSPVFQKTETLPLRSAQPQPLAAIEGLYQTEDSTYVVQIQPSRTRFRDYVGVIVYSRTPLWRVGQVKLELQRLPGQTCYRILQYNRNHSLSYLGDISQEQGYLRGTSWRKVGLPPLPVAGPLAYRALTASTAYLRLPSFNGALKAPLDSIYRLVAAAPPQNLIIDVRGNGGGSDANVVGLVPFLYTTPFQDDQREEYYVTPNNVARLTEYYHAMQQDSANYGASALQQMRATLRWLHQVPTGQFQSDPTTEMKTFTGAVGLPKQVIIVYDRGCASSCETLLFWAKHSTKTILAGENSGGFVGYGNVFSLPTPCQGLQLSTTTLRLPNQVAYEALGIVPDVHLTLEQDWLRQVLHLLKRP